MLLDCNPCLAKYSTFGGLNSPLHFAAAKGHNEIVALLLENGVDVNSMNYCGQVPDFDLNSIDGSDRGRSAATQTSTILMISSSLSGSPESDIIHFFQFFWVHHDMNAPPSHYFIYTGHNSYLSGNQLTSDCSDVLIIKALKKGVRVIKLDIWLNSSKDDMHILHGR